MLRAHAGRRTGHLPADLLVRHTLRITTGGDWPLQRDAFDAILRRCAAAQSGDVEIAARPRLPGPGLYQTRRRGNTGRPYRTYLRSTGAIDGSCDCPDFLRNALGLCKHLVAALEDAIAAPRNGSRRQHGRGRRRATTTTTTTSQATALRWDPIRPLTGPGDWLERVQWVATSAPPAPLRAWMRRSIQSPPDDGPRSGHPAERPVESGGRAVWNVVLPRDSRQRHRLVERLLGLLGAGDDEPALHRLLLDERARLAGEADAATRARRRRAALRTLKQPLYPYQRDGVERVLARGRLLLADDMGLGKTAQAIAACHALWHAGELSRGLLVVPAALKPQWLREWQLFTDAPATIVDGGPAQRRAAFAQCRRGFLIANYEQLIRDLDLVLAWAPDLVVLDEAQRIKNWATRTALSVKQLDPAYRLVLTGTPMENRLDELASIVEWVDDFALEPKWRLASWHTTPADDRGGTAGARNLETLRARLAPCLVRRVRQDVLSQLPARTDTRIPIEMTPEQLDEHDALDQPIAQILGRARQRPLSQPEFLRLMSLLTTQRVIANGLAQLRFEETWPALSRIQRPDDGTLRGLSSPKLVELRELIAQLAVTQARKVVVFSQWRRMLRLAHWATADDLGRAGVRATFFTGEEGQKRRTQNIVDFHDDPACRVLFATDAGGVGLNLQRAASACINIELPWNPAVLEQRIGRIYRLGQRRPIDVYTLVSEPGIEARIADVLGSKQALFTGLFDGTTDEVRFERGGSFLSRLERLVTPARAPESAAASGVADVVDLDDEGLATSDTLPGDAIVSPAGAATGVDADAIARIVASLTVQQTPAGGLRIEAPPEAASILAALFSGVGALLRSSARTPNRLTAAPGATREP
jgi:hypothetical protein